MIDTPASTVEPISSANMIDRRTAVRLNRSDTVVNAVTCTSDGVDQLRLKWLVNLGAKARDVGFDNTGLGVEVEVPNSLQQHRPGNHLTLVAHQYLKEPELARLEVDDLAIAPDRAAD